MADKIKLLPDVVANQIAAGEVVEQPSSVIKEMMENAVDAGARCVKVNTHKSGHELIQVVDDGCGMSPVDARMAFDRHATSKISTAEDIYKLSTFGFRGEALASIAAVAEVELRTRQQDDMAGTLVRISGGRFDSQTAVAAPVGSQFVVKNLFFNIPARRAFLDSLAKSSARIKQEFQRVALCNPQIAFELYASDAPVYKLQPGTLSNRIVDIIGKHMRQNLLEVSVDTTIVNLRGYVGRPAAAKKRNSEQYLFINGRYFEHPYFAKAILRAYEKLIPESMQPSYFLYFTIEPDRVDVNVSPHKTKIKFSDTDSEAIWQIVNAAVRETLAKNGAVPLMDFSSEAQVEIPVYDKDSRAAAYAEPRSTLNSSYNPFAYNSDEGDDQPKAATHSEVESMSLEDMDFSYRAGVKPNAEFDEEEFVEFDSSSLNFEQHNDADTLEIDFEGSAPAFESVLSVGEGYAVALWGGRLVAVDLRRAKQRLLYDSYLGTLNSGVSASQQLLFPEEIVLSSDEYELLERYATEFAIVGFDLEMQGEGKVRVRGVPADMGGEFERLIYELLNSIDELSPQEARRQTMAEVMARTGAISMVGTSSESAQELLRRLSESGNVSFSPSGAPIMAEITIDEIRSKLK